MYKYHIYNILRPVIDQDATGRGKRRALLRVRSRPDGDLDIVAVAHGVTDEVHLWANDGVGNLTFAGFLPMTSTLGLGAGLCVADLDFDLDIDLAVAQPQLVPTIAQTIRTWRYTGSGSLDAGDFTVSADVTSPGVVAVALACADLDQDRVAGFGGGTDLVVVNGGNSVVEVHYGFSEATQTFGAFGPVSSGSGPVDAALGDLDGDMTVDVVIANQTGNSVTIHRTDGAIARTFGTGCAGTGGAVPRIGALGLPRLGGSFGVQVTLARSLSGVLLAFSFSPAALSFGGGCTLYLDQPMATLFRFTDASGQNALSQFIPNASVFLGLDAFYQWGVFDPAGAYFNTVAFSDALRVQIGR